MISKLKNILEELYETFEIYKSGPSMKGSPLYSDLDKWNKAIFSKPLKELSEDDLSRYTGKAMTTWGNSQDFKHFLPRILELTAELRTPYEIWIAFGKLELADWKNWEETKRKLVEEYMIALWENLLSDESVAAECNFQNYFSAIAHFYPEFKDLLDIWEKSGTKASVKHLSNLIVEQQKQLFERNKISGFYDKSENAGMLTSWLLSAKIIQSIQDSYFKFEKEDFAEQISLAEQILTNESKKRI